MGLKQCNGKVLLLNVGSRFPKGKNSSHYERVNESERIRKYQEANVNIIVIIALK